MLSPGWSPPGLEPARPRCHRQGVQGPSSRQQAEALAARGRAAEAVALLDREAAAGDPEAGFTLGLWLLEGRLVARDAARSRAYLGIAAELGSAAAARIHTGFLATGTGGPPDWAGAVAALDRWSDRDALAAEQRSLIAAMGLTEAGDPAAVPKPEMLSETPHVARLPGLFSADECRFLVGRAEARFKPALIFHEGRQAFVRDPVRDSDSAGFPLVFENPVVHALNRRIAAASGTDVSRGETLQVLRYAPGQQYRPHLDAVPGLDNQRSLTVIVYLSDDYAGGETCFPHSGLAVKGARGDGLLFRNALPDGRPDPATRHCGNPVSDGVKLIASRWIRERPPADPDRGFGSHEVSPAAS